MSDGHTHFRIDTLWLGLKVPMTLHHFKLSFSMQSSRFFQTYWLLVKSSLNCFPQLCLKFTKIEMNDQIWFQPYWTYCIFFRHPILVASTEIPLQLKSHMYSFRYIFFGAYQYSRGSLRTIDEMYYRNDGERLFCIIPLRLAENV